MGRRNRRWSVCARVLLGDRVSSLLCRTCSKRGATDVRYRYPTITSSFYGRPWQFGIFRARPRASASCRAWGKLPARPWGSRRTRRASTPTWAFAARSEGSFALGGAFELTSEAWPRLCARSLAARQRLRPSCAAAISRDGGGPRAGSGCARIERYQQGTATILKNWWTADDIHPRSSGVESQANTLETGGRGDDRGRRRP